MSAPERLEFHESSRIRTAAYLARVRYPGPVGDLVADELIAWSSWGYRFGPGRAAELVTFLMKPADTNN